MQNVLDRFTSRKFLLSIAGVVLVIIVPEYADSIVQIVGMFVGAEGVRDLAEAVRKNK